MPTPSATTRPTRPRARAQRLLAATALVLGGVSLLPLAAGAAGRPPVGPGGLTAPPPPPPPIALSVADAEAWEGDLGSAARLEFVVTASRAPSEPLTFRFHTGIVGFGAEPGVDHEVVDLIAEIPAGATQVTIEVPIHGDVLDEADELLFGWADTPSAGSFGFEGTSIGRILDDDGPGEGPGPVRGLAVGGLTARR